MKRIFFFLLLLTVCSGSFAQSYYFVGNASGRPLLYSINHSEQIVAQPLKKVKAWDILSGDTAAPHPVDLKAAAPDFFNIFSWARSVTAGKDRLERICAVGDSLLGFDDKMRVRFAIPVNGKFEKSDEIKLLSEANKEARKAKLPFIVSYDRFSNRIYYLRNGSLYRTSLANLEAEEEVIKPVGGLRLIGFWLYGNGAKALLKFIPSHLSYNQWSSYYNDEIYRLFDLATARPVSGLNFKNSHTFIASPEGNTILTSTYDGGIHRGWLYDVANEKELRSYGPAIVQRTKGFMWTSYLASNRYLVNIPANGPAFVKVYDLLDSLRPVNEFSLVSTTTRRPVIKATLPLASFPNSATVSQIIQGLKPLDLPVALTSFYRPAPGKLIPPALWRQFGFTVWYNPIGTVTDPTAKDSAEGSFRVYAVGELSSSPAGKTFVLASHHFYNRNFQFSENESYSTLEYWLFAYENKTGKVTRLRRLVGDDKLFVSETAYAQYNEVSIDRLSSGELYINTSPSYITINPQTLQIK